MGVIDREVSPATLGDQLINARELSARPFAFMCPVETCYYAVSAESQEAAVKIRDEHECPYIGGITHMGSTVTLTLLETAWVKADLIYEKYCDESAPEERRKNLASQLTGMCKVIAIFMPPLMHTYTEVADEIRKRKNMRDADETYETPGLGSRRYETAGTNTPRKIPEVTLAENVQAGIKMAYEAKLFSVAELATQFKVTETTIRTVLGV